MYVWLLVFFFFFKQKTAYEMRISDWSSDVCSSDLSLPTPAASLAAASELAQGGLSGRLIIETSTVSPHDVAQLCALAAQHGATVVDAAIVGGVHKQIGRASCRERVGQYG